MPWEPKAAFAAVAEYYEQVSTDPPSSEPLPRRGHRVAKLLANPRLSSSGNSNAGYVPWRYIAQHPYVTYQADLPGYTKRSFEVEQMLLVSGIQDVTNGYSSSSAYSSAATTATQTFNDGVNDILYSRRPLSDYDQLLKDWQKAAGDKMRQEYTEAMAT